MNQDVYEIAENENIAKDIYKMKLKGDTNSITASGQFINILVEGAFLRRPISVCDYKDGEITIIYKVVGYGTEKLSKMNIGDKLDILCGLGNGYQIKNCDDYQLLIGGGVGVPPLYNLARMLRATNQKVIAVLGFNSIDDVFFEKEFKDLGVETYISTVDGSYGTKGFVTDILKKIQGYDYFYTCGPMAMLRAVYDNTKTSGQFSFEERMGCGFGACMGCSCKTKYANKRICKDGPVLVKEEIIW